MQGEILLSAKFFCFEEIQCAAIFVSLKKYIRTVKMLINFKNKKSRTNDEAFLDK